MRILCSLFERLSLKIADLQHTFYWNMIFIIFISNFADQMKCFIYLFFSGLPNRFVGLLIFSLIWRIFIICSLVPLLMINKLEKQYFILFYFVRIIPLWKSLHYFHYTSCFTIHLASVYIEVKIATFIIFCFECKNLFILFIHLFISFFFDERDHLSS